LKNAENLLLISFVGYFYVINFYWSDFISAPRLNSA